MKKLIAIVLLFSLVGVTSALAQTDSQRIQSTDTSLVLRAEPQVWERSKLDSWVEPATLEPATLEPAILKPDVSTRFFIDDVPRTPERKSGDMVGWVEAVDPRTEANQGGSVGPVAVINNNAPTINGEVQLPRTYGFTRGAMLPLLGAAGDSISTHIALKQANVIERNKLINTSPAGLLGLFAIKAGAIYLLDQQKPEIRKPGLKIMAGAWNGVIANNLLIAAGATNPVGIIAGIAYGIYMYNKEGEILEQEEALAKR